MKVDGVVFLHVTNTGVTVERPTIQIFPKPNTLLTKYHTVVWLENCKFVWLEKTRRKKFLKEIGVSQFGDTNLSTGISFC